MSNQRKPRVPNSALRRIREERGWSQQQVATLLDTNTFTVCRWERGLAFPSPHYRQRLCKLFDKSLSELGLLPQSTQPSNNTPKALDAPHDQDSSQQKTRAPLAGSLSPSYWMIPVPRNPLFTGREIQLREIHTYLSASRGRALMLYGLGGIGKTQIALEYAYRYAQDYTAIFWIAAEAVASIRGSFLQIAECLALPECQETDQARIIASVQRWLALHQDWLLIWDNIETVEVLAPFLPPAQHGSMLLTTRLQNLGTLALSLELPPMQPDEGTLLLLRRATLLDLTSVRDPQDSLRSIAPAEYAPAQELVMQLGGLPLALDQVGAYLEEVHCSLSDCLQLYHSHSISLLKRRGRVIINHPEPVATTWLRSFGRVEQANGATDLLHLCTFLHPEAIPEEIFSVGGIYLGERLASLAADPLRLHEAIAMLYAHSLIKRDIKEHTLSIHRLVQLVLREGMSEQERLQWQQRVIKCLDVLFPEVTATHWKQCERLLPHILTCAASMPHKPNDLILAHLLQRAENYLHERARMMSSSGSILLAARLCASG